MGKKIILIVMLFLSINMRTLLHANENKSFMEYAADNGSNDSYINYKEKYQDKPLGSDKITINGNDYSEIKDDNFKKDGDSVVTSEISIVSYTFDIKNSGMYNIGLNYYPESGKGMDIIRSLKIDGELPFEEASTITLKRFWKNKTDIESVDGNDLQPMQVENPHDQTVMFEDADRMMNEPLQFYLSEGTHTIEFEAVQEPLKINQVLIQPVEKPVDYSDYLEKVTKDGYSETSGVNELVEAETATEKSNSMLAPDFDYTNVDVTPSDAYKKKINIIGGDKWNEPGDYIEWEINAPESGLYKISFNVLQNFDRGLYSTRRLSVNGDVPFEEAKNIRFSYDPDVQSYTFSDVDGNPYLIALDKGVNTIRLENVAGTLGTTIYELESANFVLNDIYKDVIMIAGTSPDIYRDYNIDESIPTFTDNVDALLNNLSLINEQLEADLGEKSDVTANIDKVLIQLEDFQEEPDNIIRQLNAFKSNISAIPNTIKTIKNQELTIDSITISSPQEEVNEDNGFFSQMMFNVNRFIASFVNNSDEAVSATNGGDETIEVWVTRGQDELQVWRSLIDNYFTPKTGINVDLKLVSATAILPAVLSGEGPDVAMYLAQDVPVNYATRDAVVDLSEFDDYDKVANRYYQSAITPFEYNGGVYALGEEQKFPMMFYRTDIFDELNIDAPTTWDEMFDILPVLSANNMELMLEPTAITNTGQVVPNMIFSSILYQNDGQYYENEDKQSALTEEQGVNAFDMYTKFYTNYSVDIQADFANRFKTGEVPIGIMDYTQYNQISIFAPELAGLWSVAPLPGIVEEDGSINNSAASTTTGMVMFKDTEHKDAAWEFMKWVTSDETQMQYGKEIESKVGRAGRWQSANKNALENSSYPSADLEEIVTQQANTIGVPQVPGGYITGRQVDYAFRAVVNDNENPYEVIFEYAIPINEELSAKRKEFGLDYIDWGEEDVESN